MQSGKPGLLHLSRPGYSHFSGDEKLNRFGCAKLTRVAVTPEKTMPVHLNGDRVGTTPCRLEILPGKLRVLC
jgi:diacylglycerol kinase family enzyme